MTVLISTFEKIISSLKALVCWIAVLLERSAEGDTHLSGQLVSKAISCSLWDHNPASILQLPYIFLSLLLPYLSNPESYTKETDAILRFEVLVPLTTQIDVSWHVTPCFLVCTHIYRGFSEAWRSVVRYVFTEGSDRCDAALSGRYLPTIQRRVCIPYRWR